MKAFLIGGSMIVLIGALDDRFELSAKVKFLAQIAACVVVFGFNITVDFVNIPFQDRYSMLESWVSIPLTIFWIVGVTNAINLIDGLDGLAAGVSGIAIGTILVMAVLMGNTTVALLCLCCLAALSGSCSSTSIRPRFSWGYGLVIPWILFGHAVPAWI